MNTNHIATLLLATALLAAPAGLAQTLEDQADEALQHGEEIAQDTASDPQSMAMNATNASWQGNQANWTTAWTCASAYAIDDDAGDAAQDATGCTTPQNAQAGQDDEEDNETQPRANADEADDVETAAEDARATAEAYAEDMLEDPENAEEHTLTFLNRTLTLLERLLDPPRMALSLAHGAFTGVTSAIADGVTGAIDTAKDTASSIQRGTASLAHATTTTMKTAGHASVDAITHAVESVGDAVKNLLPSPVPNDDTPPTQGPLEAERDAVNAKNLVDTVDRIADP